jgi:hypothetical protein
MNRMKQQRWRKSRHASKAWAPLHFSFSCRRHLPLQESRLLMPAASTTPTRQLQIFFPQRMRDLFPIRASGALRFWMDRRCGQLDGRARVAGHAPAVAFLDCRDLDPQVLTGEAEPTFAFSWSSSQLVGRLPCEHRTFSRGGRNVWPRGKKVDVVTADRRKREQNERWNGDGHAGKMLNYLLHCILSWGARGKSR